MNKLFFLIIAIFTSAFAVGQHSFSPLQNGWAAVTCWADLGTRDVVGFINVTDPQNNPAAIPGQNWLAPMYHHSDWTRDNLGTVFGIAMDNADNPNVFVTATTCYNKDYTGAIYASQKTGPVSEPYGAVYKLDGSSGQPSLFAELPNPGGAGLGNIAFDYDHQQLFVTNHYDGKIYRLHAGTGAILSVFDHGAAFNVANNINGFAPLGERLWGIQYHQGRLFYAVWANNFSNGEMGVTANHNEIYSVKIGSNGAFMGEEKLEITIPFYQNTYSNPVSDIGFSCEGKMMLSERSMYTPTNPTAHTARLLEYVCSGLGWVPSEANFLIGEVGFGTKYTNSAGGVDYTANGDVWATADALRISHPTYGDIYGMGWINGSGNTQATVHDSYCIDFDGDTDGQDKTLIGDVAVFRNKNCGSECEIVCPDVILDYEINGCEVCFELKAQYVFDGEVVVVPLDNAEIYWIIEGERFPNASPNFCYQFDGTGEFLYSLIVEKIDGREECDFNQRGFLEILICDPPPPCIECENSFAPEHGKKYVLSAWVKEGDSPGAVTYENANITLLFDRGEWNQEVVLGPFLPKGEIIDGWQRIEQEFVVPQYAVKIKVELNNTGTSQKVYFDDIRIHPFDANMKSFVYDPVTLRLVAELDERNYATYYEYDEEGALIRVEKETAKGRMTIQESRKASRKKP